VAGAQPFPYNPRKKRKNPAAAGSGERFRGGKWRRGRDSNPRDGSPPTHSATSPRLGVADVATYMQARLHLFDAKEIMCFDISNATDLLDAMTQTIYILNGPNLNLLGHRQPEIYGHQTLEDIEKKCANLLPDSFEIDMRQTNHEGVLVDQIHEARHKACGIVINPAAFTHTSIAILDALNTFEGPVIEVHISNVHKREAFRHHSYVSLRADGVIAGLGVEGYEAGVRRVLSLCQL
jgi:3-dehydroquinate dehydratase-2